MRRVFFLVLLVMSCIIAVSCSDDNEDIVNGDLNTPALSLSMVKEGVKVGLYPNRILSDGKYAYIVNSGDNTIGRMSLTDFSYDNNFIKLEQNTNPYSLSIKDNHLYISSSGKVSETFSPDDIIVEVNLSTGEQRVVQSSLYMVSDIITSSCIEFVQSEYDYAKSESNGKLSQICPEFTNTVNTTCKNPTRVVSNKDSFVVTCSGIYTYDSDYNITGTKDSGVCFYNTHLEESSCILDNEDTGSPAIGDTLTLIGSTYSGKLFIVKDGDIDRVDLNHNSMLVPVHLYKDTFILASFNTSTIYIYDAITKSVVVEYKLSKTELDKKGPIDVVYLSDSNRLLVLNSLSSTVDILSLN